MHLTLRRARSCRLGRAAAATGVLVVASLTGAGRAGAAESDRDAIERAARSVDTSPAPSTTPARPRTPDHDGGSLPLVPIAAAVVAGGAALGGAFVLARRARPATAPTGTPATGTPATGTPATGTPAAPGTGPAQAGGAPLPPPAAPAPALSLLANELIELADRLESEAVRREITDVLHRAGIQQVTVAQGTPFDPAQHVGIDTVPTTDPQWDHRVAATEAPGYRAADVLLRRPAVVVYRLSA